MHAGVASEASVTSGWLLRGGWDDVLARLHDGQHPLGLMCVVWREQLPLVGRVWVDRVVEVRG
jgi:hypothetical protein